LQFAATAIMSYLRHTIEAVAVYLITVFFAQQSWHIFRVDQALLNEANQ
jgi:hypothetical protein